jgi:hypothetical protein
MFHNNYQSFTLCTGAPICLIREEQSHYSPPQPGDLLCKVENKLFIPVCKVISTNPTTRVPAYLISNSFIPNSSKPVDGNIIVDETIESVDTTKITVSLLTPLPLNLAVFSDEVGKYVNMNVVLKSIFL